MTQGEMQELRPEAGETYRYRIDVGENRVTFEMESDSDAGIAPAVTLNIESRQTGEGLCRTESGRAYHFAWAWVGPELHLWLDGDLFIFQRPAPASAPSRRRGPADAAAASGDVLAPMPGAVLSVLVSEGDRVERNQTVVVMESMKMELLITAPRNGIARRVSARPGQQVERGMRLLELAPEGDDGEA